MASPDRDELLMLVLEDRAESASPWRSFAEAANEVMRCVIRRRNVDLEASAGSGQEMENHDEQPNAARPATRTR
jgi:hypothetical protein